MLLTCWNCAWHKLATDFHRSNPAPPPLLLTKNWWFSEQGVVMVQLPALNRYTAKVGGEEEQCFLKKNTHTKKKEIKIIKTKTFCKNPYFSNYIYIPIRHRMCHLTVCNQQCSYTYLRLGSFNTTHLSKIFPRWLLVWTVFHVLSLPMRCSRGAALHSC